MERPNMQDKIKIYNQAYKELPNDVRVLAKERHLSEDDKNLAVLFELFIESTVNLSEFYGFNDNKKQLFNDLKKNLAEATQLIDQYHCYRKWFEKYQPYFKCFAKTKFLTVCEWDAERKVCVDDGQGEVNKLEEKWENLRITS